MVSYGDIKILWGSIFDRTDIFQKWYHLKGLEKLCNFSHGTLGARALVSGLGGFKVDFFYQLKYGQMGYRWKGLEERNIFFFGDMGIKPLVCGPR